MYYAVGLGNPGRRYEGTRHNIGFAVMDEIARRCETVFRRSWRLKSLWAEADLGGKTVRLVKPVTMMNRSGQAVTAWQRRKGLVPESLILVYDDLALPCGRVRIRPRGGAGGHKGVLSVAQALANADFARVRVGVGSPPRGRDQVAFVLSRFGPGERETMAGARQRAADAVQHMIEHGIESAMNAINGQDA